MKLKAILILLLVAFPTIAQRVNRGGSTPAGTVRVDLSKEHVGR